MVIWQSLTKYGHAVNKNNSQEIDCEDPLWLIYTLSHESSNVTSFHNFFFSEKKW